MNLAGTMLPVLQYCKESLMSHLIITVLSYIHENISFLSQSTINLEKTTDFLSITIKEIKKLQGKVNRLNG
jgi:hypothetical protein